MGERTTPANAAAANAGFSYEAAFDRNVGWVTRDEQFQLRARKVAIAGMGGSAASTC